MNNNSMRRICTWWCWSFMKQLVICEQVKTTFSSTAFVRHSILHSESRQDEFSTRTNFRVLELSIGTNSSRRAPAAFIYPYNTSNYKMRMDGMQYVQFVSLSTGNRTQCWFIFGYDWYDWTGNVCHVDIRLFGDKSIKSVQPSAYICRQDSIKSM